MSTDLMKIAYLTNTYPKLSHTFIRREIQAMEAAGVEVVRLSIRSSGEDLGHASDQKESERTIQILGLGAFRIAMHLMATLTIYPIAFMRTLLLSIRIGLRSDVGLLRHLAYLVESCSVVQLLKEQGVRHLHVHFGTNAATVALLARCVGGIRFSMTVHGSEEFDKPALLHLGLKVAAADFVAVISYFAKSQTCRWSDPQDWPKIHVIRCAVGQTFLEAPATPVPDVPRLVCVGRLSAAKGHIFLVQAAALLKAEGYRFRVVIVGDGYLRGYLENMIDAQDLRDTVELRGSLDEEKVREEILASRCMVLPSLIEGLPVTIMEALALSRPVVASRVAGIPELLEDGVNGWLVTPGDPHQLAAAMRTALDETPDRLSEMARAGRYRVQQKHNSQIEAHKLVELFRLVMIGGDGSESHVGRSAFDYTGRSPAS